jgi:class 3 adenylate cyclase
MQIVDSGLILEQREHRALVLLTRLRGIIVLIWLIVVPIVTENDLGSWSTYGVIGLQAVVVIASYRALNSQAPRLREIGLAGAMVDVISLCLLPFGWYLALGGPDVPFGVNLKTSFSIFATLYIALNALSFRPLYPAVVTAGASVIALLLVGLALADPATVFTTDYLRASTTSDVSIGRSLTNALVVMLVGTLITLITYLGRRMTVEAAALERSTTQLSRYFSPNLVSELIKQPELFNLGGSRREVTFVFTDLQGFTSFVERSDPDTITAILNDYLEGMTAIVYRHNGTVEKIVGDAIHIMFGAPGAQPDHARRALACARDLDVFAEAFHEDPRRWPDPSTTNGEPALRIGRTRIGINTGVAMVGNFGSKTYFDYTAHGDAINTAARLEQANRQFGTRMLASEATISAAGDNTSRPVARVRLKGKSRAVKVFEPLHDEQLTARRAWYDAYMEAFGLLQNADPTALAAFEKLSDKQPDDAVVQFHRKRLSQSAQDDLVTIP